MAMGITLVSFGQHKNPKRGLAFGYHKEADFQAISGSLSWWYNWANTPDSGVAGVFGNYKWELSCKNH